MMRRKDNRMVLRPGNQQPPKKRSFFNRNSRDSRNARISRNNRSYGNNRPYPNSYGGNQRKPRSKMTIFILILMLVAFIIGAGVGITFSLDDGEDSGPHYENVTVEMTTNVTNNSSEVAYDENIDSADYNDPQSVQQSQNAYADSVYNEYGYNDGSYYGVSSYDGYGYYDEYGNYYYY